MKKLSQAEGSSADIVTENIEEMKKIFPDVFSENGVNFDVLRQLLGDAKILDEGEEKYGLNWHGKKKARQIALTPSTGTLRPCPDESVDWDKTQNLFIEGDNLQVLKLLQKSYAAKIKVIYIDPPYNTGKDFIYPDNYQDNLDTYLRYTGQKNEGGIKLSSNTESSGRKHTNWLSMMYPRLKLARNLLRDDGVILISIDDNEQADLKKIADEIFGEENMLGNLVWKKKYTGGKHSSGYVDLHEYILVYAKHRDLVSDISIDRPDNEKDKFIEEDEFINERGKFYVRPLKSNLGLRKTLIYPITAPDGSVLETQWLVAKDTFVKLLNEKRVEFRKKRDGAYQIYRKYYEKDGDGSVKPPSLIEKFPNTEAKLELKKLFDISEGRDNVFYTVKPVNLIRHLIDPYDDNDGIFLDFFAGSATTAQVILEKNLDGGTRKYILVQLPEPIEEESEFSTLAEIGKERIRRAAKKIASENPDHKGDLGFKVFKLDSSNIRAWNPDANDLEKTLLDNTEHLIPGRSDEDVLYELLLKRGVDLTVPIESKKVAGKSVYSIGHGVLFACLATTIKRDEVEEIASGIVSWFEKLKPATETHVFFRDSAFADDVTKTNLSAILGQHGITHVRSL